MASGILNRIGGSYIMDNIIAVLIRMLLRGGGEETRAFPTESI